MSQMTGRIASGAQPQSGPHHRADTQREPIQSAGVTPRRPDSRRLNAAAPFTHLKRGRIAQAVIDAVTTVVGILYIASLAASLPLAIGLMFFSVD